jgi:hypothetical protein
MTKKVFMCSLVLIAAMAANSYATMIMNLDLRIAGDGKQATIDHVGQVVNLELYATFDGTNPATTGVMTASERYTSIESDPTQLMGDISNVVRSFGSLGANGLAITTYDANPDAEWGGAYPTTSNTGYMNVADTVYHTGLSVKLADLQWTSTVANGTTGATVNLQAVAFINSTTLKVSWKFEVDGVSANNNLNATYLSSGAPVVLNIVGIPEPSTLVLLCMGCVALLAFRRRK